MKIIDTDKIMEVFLYASLTISFVLILYGAYDNFYAETIEIRKDSFKCTQSHEESSLRYDVAIKMSVPDSETVCDNYARIK